MSLACSPNLKNILNNANIVIDTCSIIDASKSGEVLDFFGS